MSSQRDNLCRLPKDIINDYRIKYRYVFRPQPMWFLKPAVPYFPIKFSNVTL